MKKMISMLIVIALCSMVGVAQKLTPSKVPQNVRKAFSKEFPRASGITWSMEETNYEVNFLLNNVKNSVVFDKDAKWLEKEAVIKVSDVPKEVKAAMKKEFAGFKATEAEKVELPDNTVQYHLGISNKVEAFEVQFSATGVVLKKEPKETKKPAEVKGKK
ncbi:MAG: PepSY-like domain-containing protein [Bacteroidetes bacterium]|nr:PepSY-like domain-containing protein [Bacteroidota bacterium]